MRRNIIVSLFLVFVIFSTGCVSKSRYDKQVERNQYQREENQEQREHIEYLRNTVSYLDDEISTLEDGDRLSTRKIKELNKTIRRLKDRVVNLETSRNSLRDDKDTRITRLTSTLRSLRKQSGKLDRALQEARNKNLGQEQRNSALGSRIDDLKRTNNQLKEELGRMRSEFSTYKEWNRTVLLDEKLYFRRASAKLTSEHKRTLDEMIPTLAKEPEELIVVIGHADTVPISNAPFSSNWDLSAKRASSVVEYITRNSSIEPTRFSVKGRGEYERNMTVRRRDVDQDLDRRVEIQLVKTR